MKLIVCCVFFLLSGVNAFAQEDKSKESKEKAVELSPMVEPVEFDKIQDVLKQDRLDKSVKKKKKQIKKVKKKISSAKVGKYDIPPESEFWNFFSEYWIVSNQTVLKWDFKKPDYGLQESFKDFLEKMGVYEVRFKILLVNSPDITHYALPSHENNAIFLLGVPFIKTLDLSKQDISLLLFEDYQRLKMGYFKDYAKLSALDEFIGGNFHKKEFDKEIISQLAKKYDELIYDKGFNFKQQFAVTKKMNLVLRSDTELWNAYYLMISKIDKLVKNNVLFQNYLKIYPSPELQLGWLRPTKKKIL